jgi:hypothetical protein
MGYEVSLTGVEARAAHDAVVAWCREHGHQPSGVRWEVYGPHDDDPARQWTEVCWLLSGPPVAAPG